MLLRSSSTPVLGSLLSSFSESPQKRPIMSNIHQQSCSKLSCNNGGLFQNVVTKTLLHSPSIAEIKGAQKEIRRVQSEGNLEGLCNTSDNCNVDDDFTFSNKFSKKLVRSQEVRLNNVNGNYGDMGFVVEDEGKMYLATGVGVQPIAFLDDGGCGCGGGGGSYRPVDFNRDGGGGNSRGLSMEERHYKRMLEQSPGNPLFLRNYAHFLYQKKGDLEGAEEYYSRAILADPEDGEILCEYAKVIWELHHDKERAAAYFERAVQASSQDCHINASYASFLWDLEEDEDEEEENAAYDSHLFNHGVMASATA